jgi:arsenate reductase (thioredoxin)
MVRAIDDMWEGDLELQLNPETRGHIERSTAALADEFQGIYSRETIERYVGESLEGLSGARLESYLPLFVHRFARERLRALAQAEGKLTKEAPEVLFVCTHNAGRSQMAAGLVDKLAAGRIHVRSAGSEPADQLNPSVVAAMAEVGVDLEREFPKPLTDEVVRAADVVITMGCGDACPIYPGKRYEDWDLEDPAGKDVETVRRIRDDIAERVMALIDEVAEPKGDGAAT